MLGFLKKKKAEEELELPAPPKPPELQTLEPDIPPIRAKPEYEKPEIPEFKLDGELPTEQPEELPQELRLPEFQPKTEYEKPEELEITKPEYKKPEELELPPEPGVIPARLKIPELPKPKVFDKTITEEIPREAVIEKPEAKPLFVAVDDYNNVRSNTNIIRAKLLEAEEYIQRLSDLKIEEEKSFARWKKHLEDVEKKLTYVDKVIAKAQG